MRPLGANANAQLILPGEKKNYSKSSDNFYLKYHQKTQSFQSVRQSSFCHYRTCSETDTGKSKIENVENSKKRIVQEKNATSEIYLIAANDINLIRLISN